VSEGEAGSPLGRGPESGHDPRVLGSRPILGSLLSGESASPLPLQLPSLSSLTLSQKIKNLKKKQ